MGGKAKATVTGPDHLTLELFAPGMSALHRAGLGGLACTLKAMERQHKAGLLADEKLPGSVADGKYPWEVDERAVTLRFGRPEHAGPYLKKLFAFAFQIRDGVIYLPGQYPDPPPPLAVRVDLQNAITRTVLQGAKKNIVLEANSTTFSFDPDGTGKGYITVDYKRCVRYLHQSVWEYGTDTTSGNLLPVPRKVGDKAINFGSLYAGAIKRHDALNESDLLVTTSELFCSSFFLVGCVASLLNWSGDGVVLVPEVTSLDDFALDRPRMTAQTAGEVRVGGAADAAYQLEVRVLSRGMANTLFVPGCSAQRFSLRTWTKPQKSRVNTTSLDMEGVERIETEAPTARDTALDRFERALALLPRGVRYKYDQTTYWQDSVIRPLIAENLAAERSWYAGFRAFASSRRDRTRLFRESEGLNAMIQDNVMWNDEQEQVVVRAVHSALLSLGGQIAEVYRNRPKLRFKKYDDEREKWGRMFAGSMTVDQFRKNLTDMFRRAGKNQELQRNWQLLLPMLHEDCWKRARDLAIIGLCSFQPPESKESDTDQENAE